jgi:hypothetical protein
MQKYYIEARRNVLYIIKRRKDGSDGKTRKKMEAATG